MRARWVAPLLLAACFTTKSTAPGEDIEDIDMQRGACTAFEGVTFESLAKHECGLTPDGVARCHWHVTLESLDPMRSGYVWSYSDVMESGTVRCTGRAIELVEAPRGSGPIGTYDDVTGELTWDDIVYVRGS